MDPPGISYLPNYSPANPSVQVSAARSDPTLPPTTPIGDTTNIRHPPLPPPPPNDSPSPAYDTADPPKCFHFFRNSSSVFSQWYLCDIEYEGVTYNCAEQMMMAQKPALFGDTATELCSRTTPDPVEQKALGRIVSSFDQERWVRHRHDIVLDTNFCKFSQNLDLQRAQAATSEKHIAEASPYSLLWGIGYKADHPFACDKTRWCERNLLGRIFMDVREGLGSNLLRLLYPR